MRTRAFATAMAAALVVGCNQSPEIATPTTPVFAAGGKADQTPRARLSYVDSVNVGTALAPQWVPAGYRGDGRLRDGTPGGVSLSNEYQGNFCGVNANIGTGTSGQSTQFTFDPNQYWSTSLPASCQPARYVRVYLNGPTEPPGQTRQHQFFPELGSMAVGDTLIKVWNNGTGAELGINLWFDDAYPPASSVRWIRLPNVVDEFDRSVRQWRIETRGSHRAMGAVKGPGKNAGLVPTGTTYYLPFSMTVTEVPYPFPTYP